MDLDIVFPFEKPGFFFIYQPQSIAKEKLLARYVWQNFLRMENETRLMKCFLREIKTVVSVSFADFHRRCTPENHIPHVWSLQTEKYRSVINHSRRHENIYYTVYDVILQTPVVYYKLLTRNYLCCIQPPRFLRLNPRNFVN